LICRAETGGWVSRDGKPALDTDAMKSINGFGGWLVVTPDKDWEKKWNTSPETVPHFTEAKKVSYGEQLTILTFFINPKTTSLGTIDIQCDIKIVRPDGSVSSDVKGVDCGSGILRGDPKNIRLTYAIIKYSGDAGDPPGEWTVNVVLTDRIRGTAISLKTSFNLLESRANKITSNERNANAALGLISVGGNII